ncbi:predicted protein [Histoplasma capsulatum var. duboisii H88]|uniref:Predicted protein n=2 Tax=Ajellomyces capsulatus TaxID=5037 RepID=F0UPU5_AJEC8|nr:predicted protein [Histoplasma capsulatum H143]EGC47840.1 predicted protein [Histoplasma capsulatum var. duboisii H88]
MIGTQRIKAKPRPRTPIAYLASGFKDTALENEMSIWNHGIVECWDACNLYRDIPNAARRRRARAAAGKSPAKGRSADAPATSAAVAATSVELLFDRATQAQHDDRYFPLASALVASGGTNGLERLPDGFPDQAASKKRINFKAYRRVGR